jgi:histidine phosphotransfer protein HptB
MADTTIDIAVFRGLQDAAGEDFAKELVETFLEEAPTMLAELRDALAANDADKFRRAAHSLKSNSLTFGAMPLGAMARELEHKGLERARLPGSDGVGPVEALDQEYARVAAALTELRDG